MAPGVSELRKQESLPVGIPADFVVHLSINASVDFYKSPTLILSFKDKTRHLYHFGLALAIIVIAHTYR
jgi:hypothetical protein